MNPLEAILGGSMSPPQETATQIQDNAMFDAQAAMPEVEKYLDKKSSEGFAAAYKNILLRTAQVGEKITPDVAKELFLTAIGDEEIRKKVEKAISPEGMKEQEEINNKRIETASLQNPFLGTANHFVAEAIPYAMAGDVYHGAIKNAQSKLAQRLGKDDFITKTAAAAVGSMPVTAGVDILQNRSADEMVTNQLFDLLAAPVFGKFMRNVDNTATVPGSTREPIRNEPIDITGQTVDPMYAKYDIEGKAKPETVEAVEKNNMYDEILTRDLKDIESELDFSITPEIRAEVEDFFKDGVDKKQWYKRVSNETEQVVGRLLAMDEYSNGTFKLADTDTFARTERGEDIMPIDEGNKATINTLDDINTLRDDVADINDKIAIIQKYNTIDPEFPYLTREIEDLIRKRPELVNNYAIDTIKAMENDMRQSRLMNDTPSAKKIDMGEEPNSKRSAVEDGEQFNESLEMKEANALHQQSKKQAKMEANQRNRIAKGKETARRMNESLNVLKRAVDRATTQRQLDFLVKKSLRLKSATSFDRFKERVIEKRKEIEINTKEKSPDKELYDIEAGQAEAPVDYKSTKNAQNKPLKEEANTNTKASVEKPSEAKPATEKPDYSVLKKADKEWMEKYDQRRKEFKRITKSEANKREKLLNEIPKRKEYLESKQKSKKEFLKNGQKSKGQTTKLEEAELKRQQLEKEFNGDEDIIKERMKIKKQRTAKSDEQKYKGMDDEELKALEEHMDGNTLSDKYKDLGKKETPEQRNKSDEEFLRGKNDKVPEPEKTKKTEDIKNLSDEEKIKKVENSELSPYEAFTGKKPEEQIPPMNNDMLDSNPKKLMSGKHWQFHDETTVTINEFIEDAKNIAEKRGHRVEISYENFEGHEVPKGSKDMFTVTAMIYHDEEAMKKLFDESGVKGTLDDFIKRSHHETFKDPMEKALITDLYQGTNNVRDLLKKQGMSKVEDNINTKKERAKARIESTEKMRGEIGKDTARFIDPVANKAKTYDKKSAELFTEPTASHIEHSGEGSGYYIGGDVHLNTMTKASLGFTTYTHEIFHKILDTHMMDDIIEAYKKNAEGEIPTYIKDIDEKYGKYDELVRYEESIVIAATDKFIDSLPKEIKERLDLPKTTVTAGIKDLTPEMQSIIDTLVDHATTALNSKGNYLNEFAHGEKLRVFDRLDRIGEKMLSKLIDKSMDKLKYFEQEMIAIGELTDNATIKKAADKYHMVRDKANEILQNVMSQANKLPAQEFIDKITSISRHTEEIGRNFGDTAATMVKETIPNRKVRELLTPVVIMKDLQSVRSYIHDIRTPRDLKKKKMELYKNTRQYLDEKTTKVMKQTIKGLSDDMHMNSPYWRHNAYEVLMESKEFNKLVQQFHKTKSESIKTQIQKITKDVDELMTLSALTPNDMKLIRDIEPERLSKILDIHAEAVAKSKGAMPVASHTLIKGYRPSLFRNYVEFTDKPPLHSKDIDGWKLYKNGIWYREALKPDSSRSMFIAKNQIPKGQTWDIPEHVKNYEAYAEKVGAGIVEVEGQLKLRQVVDLEFRKRIMNENFDIAENIGAMFEKNIHDKASTKHDVEILDGINKHNLIGNIPADNMIKMTEKEVNLLPIRIKKALHKAYGEEIYIDKTYKEQLIGYSHDMSALKHLEKSGIEVTHGMMMAEAKALDVLAEMTQLIKQTIILKNPVVLAGNFMFQNFMALNEGVPLKNIAKYQKEGVKDFHDYIKLTEKKIRLDVEGKSNTPEYKDNMKKLESNVAYRLFMESKDGGGIDRNLLIKSLRDRDLSRKHIESYVTKKLGGEDSVLYKTGSFLFITPESLIGSMIVKGLNYTDYLGRSTLMRHYLQTGMSFEEAARKANSKTVSFSKQLPSSIAWAERYGADHFLTWTLRSAVGIGTSMKEHPSRWLAFATAYYASTEAYGKYDSRYFYDVRTSSFNPTEAFLSQMFDGGIYSNIADKGVMAFEPEFIRKVREGKNPILTTK